MGSTGDVVSGWRGGERKVASGVLLGMYETREWDLEGGRSGEGSGFWLSWQRKSCATGTPSNCHCSVARGQPQQKYISYKVEGMGFLKYSKESKAMNENNKKQKHIG